MALSTAKRASPMGWKTAMRARMGVEDSYASESPAEPVQCHRLNALLKRFKFFLLNRLKLWEWDKSISWISTIDQSERSNGITISLKILVINSYFVLDSGMALVHTCTSGDELVWNIHHNIYIYINTWILLTNFPFEFTESIFLN